MTAPTLNRPHRGGFRGARKALAVVVVLHATALALLVWTAGDHAAQALGLAIVAYLAGVKHSYDWDHIAAIDNSSRRFASRGQHPMTVGLAFSLGHCTVVVAAATLVVAGAGFVAPAFEEGTAANLVLTSVGAGASGVFLLALGVFNLGAFRATAQSARRLRAGERLDPSELEPRGLASRLVARPLGAVQGPRELYVVGLLFGLGFDTATTIGLLVTTATAVLAGVPAVALLALPFAFSASMTLCDTLNGIAMMRLYRQALAMPERRLGFNLVVTGMSAASALFVAALTLGELARLVFGLTDPLTSFLAGVDLGDAGLLLVASFGLVWGAAGLLGVLARRSV
jgi:high-affinity nickel-transport protein